MIYSIHPKTSTLCARLRIKAPHFEQTQEETVKNTLWTYIYFILCYKQYQGWFLLYYFPSINIFPKLFFSSIKGNENILNKFILSQRWIDRNTHNITEKNQRNSKKKLLKCALEINFAYSSTKYKLFQAADTLSCVLHSPSHQRTRASSQTTETNKNFEKSIQKKIN